MSDKYFIGLINSIYSSAEAALGEEDSPLTRHLRKDNLIKRSTAEKSMLLLDMLQRKTSGNLDETELSTLLKHQKSLRDALDQLETN